MSIDNLGIDLDAAIRESSFPDGIPVTYKGTQYTLPAELPIDVLDPLLSKEFDLVGLLRTVVEGDKDGKGDIGDAIISALFERPDLPLDIRDTLYASLRLLFGAEQWDDLAAKRPGVNTLVLLVKGIFRAYGVSLGEAFASRDSSEAGGATSSPTSNASTSSTPEPSSVDPAPAPGTSVFGVSATS